MITASDIADQAFWHLMLTDREEARSGVVDLIGRLAASFAEVFDEPLFAPVHPRLDEIVDAAAGELLEAARHGWPAADPRLLSSDDDAGEREIGDRIERCNVLASELHRVWARLACIGVAAAAPAPA